MSIVLDLPPELESKLAARASEQGLPLPEYVLQLLNGEAAREPVVKTGADLLAYWQREGVIGSRPDIADSTSTPAPFGSRRRPVSP